MMSEIAMFRQSRSPWGWHPSTSDQAANANVQSKGDGD
jgi:hypothetical protein